MKKLITLSILCILIGCKEKSKKAQPEVGTLPASTVTQKVDTTINQEVWYGRGGAYYLHTYVITEAGQLHPKTDNYNYYIGEVFSPYFITISGSFDYIKKHKQSEYIKAHKFMYEIPDSVNILNSIKVQ